jgi:hypothetical protein
MDSHPEDPAVTREFAGHYCATCRVDFNSELKKKFHMISGEHIALVNAMSTQSLAGLGNVYALGRPKDAQATVSPASGLSMTLGDSSPGSGEGDTLMAPLMAPPISNPISNWLRRPCSSSFPLGVSLHTKETNKQIQSMDSLLGEEPAVSPTEDVDSRFFCYVCSVDSVDQHNYILHLSRFSHYFQRAKLLKRQPVILGDPNAEQCPLPITCLDCDLGASSIPHLQQHVSGEKRLCNRGMSSARSTDQPACKKRLTRITYNM